MWSQIYRGLPRFGVPILAAFALGFSVFSVVEGRPPRVTFAPPIPPPQSPFASRIAGLGIVEPSSETIAIATDLGGVARRIYVIDGDRVAAGQPLFALDDRDYKAEMTDADATVSARAAALNRIERQIELQQATVAQQEARLQGSQAQLRLTQSNRDRQAILVNDKIISRQLYERTIADDQSAQADESASRSGLIAAEKQGEVLKAQKIEAEAQLKSAQAGQQRAAIVLEKSIVRAPIDATVLRVNIHVGEYAQPGVLAAPLMTLGALDRLHLRVQVDEEDAWRIAAAAPAVAMVRGNPALHTRLKFVRFEPTAVAKHNLNGMDERVDERVIEAIYSFDPTQIPARVGQALDVFIEASPQVSERVAADNADRPAQR
jgi:HlyD family secretion protein